MNVRQSELHGRQTARAGCIESLAARSGLRSHQSRWEITADVAGRALKMLIPAEERTEATDDRTAIPSEVRREVWRRDSGKCVKCGSRERLEYDHIIPVAKGGSNTRGTLSCSVKPATGRNQT